jgi:phosphonate transport system substrate-binding protein
MIKMDKFFHIIFFLLLLSPLKANEPLVFGALSIVDSKITIEKFKPLIKYLETKLNRPIIFKVEKTYNLTIESFVKGNYDFGWIGPSPYVNAQKRSHNTLKLIAAMATKKDSNFNGVIVTRKDAPISSLKELKNKKFCFGSRHSTLSYYVPKAMLLDAHVQPSKEYFFGKHDKVAKQVIMGGCIAGGIKESIADQYKKYLKVIAKSASIPAFSIVCTKKCNNKLFHQIQTALLELNDISIIKSIEPKGEKFVLREDKAYDHLRVIMDRSQ